MKFVALIFAGVCISLWGSSVNGQKWGSPAVVAAFPADMTSPIGKIYGANLKMKGQRPKQLQYQEK